MKLCTKCGILKENSQFNKRKDTKDGLTYECKECNKERSRRYLQDPENRERARLRSNQFFLDHKAEHYAQSREHYLKNRDSYIQRAKEYYQNKENRKKIRQNKRDYKKRQRELEKAHLLVNAEKKKIQEKAHAKICYALKKGYISKPLQCEKCPATGKLEGHHHDYSKPLDVNWLCKRCHIKEHKFNINLEK